MKPLKKNFLILGCPRSGTHRVKEFIRYNIKKKKTNKNNHLIAQDDIFLKKTFFYVHDPYIEKRYRFIKKKNLCKKRILSTHNYYDKIASDFKKYQFIVTLRDPISTTASMISYSIKKDVMKINPVYKIDNYIDLISNKKIIKRYINNYINFYKKILKKKDTLYFENTIFIDYHEALTDKLSKYNFTNHKITKSRLHETAKNKKKIKELIQKNYDFTLAKKMYELCKKLPK
jgi:hypothetical protein